MHQIVRILDSHLRNEIPEWNSKVSEAYLNADETAFGASFRIAAMAERLRRWTRIYD